MHIPTSYPLEIRCNHRYDFDPATGKMIPVAEVVIVGECPHYTILPETGTHGRVVRVSECAAHRLLIPLQRCGTIIEQLQKVQSVLESMTSIGVALSEAVQEWSEERKAKSAEPEAPTQPAAG